MNFHKCVSRLAVVAFAAVLLIVAFVANAKPNTHIPAAVAHSKAIAHMRTSETIHMAIALAPKNREAISAFVDSLYDPASANYHKFITPEQFGARFGASEQDYAALQHWATSKGLKISKTYKNRMLLSVDASAGNIEKALHVSMNIYRHPKEARTFFSADREPTIEAPVTIASIEGLSSYWKPHTKSHKSPKVAPKGGTGPGGAYIGNDFRKAYVPNTTLTGQGETVGLLQYDNFYTNDIVAYRQTAGLPDIPLNVVPIDGGVASPGDGNSEVSLDIAMVMSMAPGVSQIYVYEAPGTSPWGDIIGRMADDNLSRQLSCSWGGGEPDDSIEVVFQQMAAQGQSFFNATGDSDALVPPIEFPSESPSITQVGGTTLSTSASGAWIGEMVWNWGYLPSYGVWYGSSGGSSGYYAIPDYQKGISMAGNNGSTAFRNIPDVALTADNVWVTYDNGFSGSFGGTSCAAPLWAGFMALVNQANIASNHPPAGFINPLIYGTGKAHQVGAFHDVTWGNNTNGSSDGLYFAASGYDLCTGWGSPGTNLLSLFLYVNDLRGLNAIGYPTAAIITWNTLSNATTQVVYGTTTNYGSVSTLDPTLRTNHTVLLTGLSPDTLYYFQAVSIYDGAVFSTNGTFTTTATLVMQQADATYSGDWILSSSADDMYGSNFQYAVTSSNTYPPSATATFNATLPVAGLYDVSMWWPSGANNSTNVPVLVSGATNTIGTRVDQTAGGYWALLCSNVNCSGGTASVELMNSTGENGKVVVADAVKFSYDIDQDKSIDGSVPQWWSQYYFGSTRVSGSADADGDGYSNFTEYVLGTTPKDSASQLALSSKATTDGVQIVFSPYQGGRIYTLQYRVDLDSPWTSLTDTPTVDANGNGLFAVSSSMTGFFRLQVSFAP